MPMRRADSSNMFCEATASVSKSSFSDGEREESGTYVAQRDADELAVLGALLDVVRDDRHVLEVEGGVDLVEEVERRRLRAEERGSVPQFLTVDET